MPYSVPSTGGQSGGVGIPGEGGVGVRGGAGLGGLMTVGTALGLSLRIGVVVGVEGAAGQMKLLGIPTLL